MGKKKKGLMEQDLSKLDVTKLHPLSPEVMTRQPTINIGTIGHVAHGKSKLVEVISGIKTGRFKQELQRNITMTLGYANAKIYKCEDRLCSQPYKSYESGKEDSPLCDVPGCGSRRNLWRHVSFVDCPGHESYMANMINGSAIFDGGLLLIGANESCPQPQTVEHLAAVEIMGLKHMIVLQNKIDLIQEKNVAINHHEAILEFTQGTIAEGAPVIPISAQYKANIDILLEYIVKKIPVPKFDTDSPPIMTVIRSFDVNKPGSEDDEIRGGVVGGSILRGVLRVGQLIEVRPGHRENFVTDESGNIIGCTPIYSRIVSMYSEQNELQYAVPGGLIGVGTNIDPALTRSNGLVGQVVGEVGKLPDVFIELEVSYFLMKRLVGVKTKDSENQGRVSKLVKDEKLKVNVGSMTRRALVINVRIHELNMVWLKLEYPVCTSKGEKITLIRKGRLIGWGEIKAGTTIDVAPPPPELTATLQ